MPWKGSYDEDDDDDCFEFDNVPQSPDTLINKKIGEINGQPLCVEDFAAWDFRHRKCELVFEPIFMVNPQHSRVPQFMGMLITCKKCREQFTKPA